jgi:hypothetical protein
MAELSTNNLFYVQTQTGIGSDGDVFTDDQLNILYTLAGSDVTETILMVLRAIAADTAKLTDYRIAQSAESLSQAHKHIKDLMDYWEEQAQTGAQQVALTSFRTIPPVERKKPSDGRNRSNRGYPRYDP